MWKGKRGNMAIVKFAWIRACVKASLLDDLDHSDQQKWKPGEGDDGYCMLNALPGMEDSVSMCL